MRTNLVLVPSEIEFVRNAVNARVGGLSERTKSRFIVNEFPTTFTNTQLMIPKNMSARFAEKNNAGVYDRFIRVHLIEEKDGYTLKMKRKEEKYRNTKTLDARSGSFALSVRANGDLVRDPGTKTGAWAMDHRGNLHFVFLK